MSLKDLDKVINWLKKSNVKFVQILGGEPTLHPEILNFVRRIIDNNVTISSILTNGLGDAELYKKIVEMTKTNWLVNVNSPASYGKDDWELLKRNLETLKWNNENLAIDNRNFDIRNWPPLSLRLAITLYEKGQDFSYIIDLAKKYNCSLIRYDISRPSSDKSNVFIDFEHLIEIKTTWINFVKECVRQEIRPGIDCAAPLCIFTQEELRFLLLFDLNFKGTCVPHLDVMPDLSVEYCASMRGILPSYKIENMSVADIFNRHLIDVREYQNHLLPRCNNCYNFIEKLCQGYCLRFKVDSQKNDKFGKIKFL